jgi:hypothetical protein
MSCKEHRQAILDSLAAGVDTLPAAVNQHLPSCTACRDYYEAQSDLFCSIDNAVGLIANSPVPPSLLPTIRTRVVDQAAFRPLRSHGWPLTAFAMSTLAIIALVFFWNRPRLIPRAPDVARQTVSERNEAVSTVGAVTPPSLGPPPRISNLRVLPIPPATAEEPAQEVIVLPEEREAFTRFVSRMPYAPDTALALTRPAEARNESPVEIALLRIDTLRVEPLDRNN